MEDLFFSTTNLRGFITSCNPVFVQVSDYDIGDLIGAPHSIVRHPDMPRAVFKVLWNAMKAGQPLAAYVKNLAADGCYYWVMAVSVPVRSGYLSIRLKPSTEIRKVVENEYRLVLELEHNLEAQGLPQSKVLEQSVPALLAGLAKHGFASYAAFQNTALPAEIASRLAAVAGELQEGEAGTRQASELWLGNRRVLTWVSNLFENLDQLVATNEELARRSHFLLDLARSIHIFALNAGLASSILGVEGRALEAVTKQLQETSKEIVRTIEQATAGVEEAIDLIREVGFLISISTLQSEMVNFEVAADTGAPEIGTFDPGTLAPGTLGYRGSIARSAPPTKDTDRRVQVLAEALINSIQQVFDLSDSISGEVNQVSSSSRSLFALLDKLQFGLLAGRIEIARLADRRGIVDMFSEISHQLVEAESEIKLFGEETENAAVLIERFELEEGREALGQFSDQIH